MVGVKDYKVCNISAGVSSFIAGWLVKDTIDEWIYIHVEDQHEDSMRFIFDCEKAIGKKITILKSKEYKDTDECFRALGGFRSLMGGGREFIPCTNWLKKRVRVKWEAEHPDYNITYVWGFDRGEIRRAERMTDMFPEYEHEFPLIEKNLSKEDVHGYFQEHFDFRRPLMYDLGFPNNNCIGCVHGGMGYWNNIRIEFPEIFEKRAKLERELGRSILKQCYLDELEPTRGDFKNEIIPDCGIMCILADMDKGD